MLVLLTAPLEAVLVMDTTYSSSPKTISSASPSCAKARRYRRRPVYQALVPENWRTPSIN